MTGRLCKWGCALLVGRLLLVAGCGPGLQRELDVLLSPQAFDSLLFIPRSVVVEFLENFSLLFR